MPQLIVVFGTLKKGFTNFPTSKDTRVGGCFIAVIHPQS